MIPSLRQLHEETLALVEDLAEADVERFESLIRLRDIVLMEMNESIALSDDDKQIVREVQERHHLIVNRMMTLKEEAAHQLQKINESKMQKNFYEPSYSGFSHFIDRKK